MLEGLKFHWNFRMLQKYFKKAEEAYHDSKKVFHTGQYWVAINQAEKALDFGKKALATMERINPKNREEFEAIVKKIEEWRQAVIDEFRHQAEIDLGFIEKAGPKE